MNHRWSVLGGLLVLSSVAALGYQPGAFYYQAQTKDKVIALTFDDGPGAFTPQILDFLKAHHARATFFIEGDQVAAYPAYVRRTLGEGHEIGNHLFLHRDFHKVKERPAEQFTKELEDTEAAIRQALGKPEFKVRVLRMPHGAYGKFNREWMIPILKERGYSLVHWSFGTDWFLRKSAEQMAQEYLQNARPGAVLLFHDGGRHREKTLKALEIVVTTLEPKGYRFVAAEDLFGSR